MVKVKRSNSTSARADGLTDARRWLFVLEINDVCGVSGGWLGSEEEEATSFEVEEASSWGSVFSSWPCSIVAGFDGVISKFSQGCRWRLCM